MLGQGGASRSQMRRARGRTCASGRARGANNPKMPQSASHVEEPCAVTPSGKECTGGARTVGRSNTALELSLSVADEVAKVAKVVECSV